MCQAPEWVIDNTSIKRKKEAAPHKAKKLKYKSAPSDRVSWSESTFNKLIDNPSEMLHPRFKIDFGLIINLLQSEYNSMQAGGGYGVLVSLIRRTPFLSKKQTELLIDAKHIFRSLLKAGVVEKEGQSIQVAEDLQNDFQVSGEAGVCPPDEDCNHLCLQSFTETPASLLQGSLSPGETFNVVVSVCNYIEQAGERDDNITGKIQVSFSGSDKPIYIDWSFTPVQNITSP